MDRTRIEAVVRSVCEGRDDIAAVYLHGSQARGTAHAASDVDVAVLYRDAPPPGLAAMSLGLEAALEKGLSIPVQAITLNTAPPELVHRVLRDDCLLLERDASARVRFEVRMRNEYFDLKPYLD